MPDGVAWLTAKLFVTGRGGGVVGVAALAGRDRAGPRAQKHHPGRLHSLQTDVVVEAKLTGSSALTCAAITNGGPPKIWLGIGSNVMVCEPVLTVKLCITGVAARKLAFPAWLAVIVQVPSPTTVTVATLTVQADIVLDANVTVRPELAVALTVNGAMPKFTLLKLPKLMVCDCGAETVIVIVLLGGEAAFPEPPPYTAAS